MKRNNRIHQERPSTTWAVIIKLKIALCCTAVWLLVVFCISPSRLLAQQFLPEQLPGTELFRLSTHEEIVESQYAELEDYFNAEIRRQRAERKKELLSDALSQTGLEKFIQSKRLRFLESIGAQAERRKVANVQEKVLGEEQKYQIKTAEWTAFTIGAERSPITVWCLVLIPKKEGPLPAVVALPDATETPEMISGLSASTPSNHQFAKRLVENGYVTLVPYLIPRENFSGVSSSPPVNDRQWLFSLGYQVGQPLIGTEVLKLLSCIDYLQQLKTVDASKIAIYGSGQGGLMALSAVAADERIRAAAILDVFQNRDPAHKIGKDNNRWTPSFMIPIDQTIWGFEQEFGYATIASMVAPRPLIVVSSVQEGDTHLRRGGSNVEMVREFYKKLGSANQFEIIAPTPGENNGSDYHAILVALNRQLQPGNSASSAIVPGTTRIDQAALDQVRNLQFQELQQAYSVLVADSYSARKKRWSQWSQVDYGSVKKYQASIEAKRSAYFDFIGRYPEPSGSVRAFSKRIPEYETEKFSGYHLSVEVYPGVSAYGILLLPKGLKPGEKRPVVFTQHGAEGGPQYAIGLTDASQDHYYHQFGKRLAERGYVVFAPMICTQDKRRYELAQKAALLAKTIPGVELRKMNRVIDFLTTVPSADSSRIGFYGLSWGGFTSLWLSPGEPRLTAVITSGHFNDWSVKTTNLYLRTSFLRNGCAFDFYIFNILNHFDHSDLASLIAPRPYLIEIGHEDGVNVKPYRLIEMEMDEVASLYEALGIKDRFEKNEFQGGHTIHGVESLLVSGSLALQRLELSFHELNLTSVIYPVKLSEMRTAF